MNIYIENYCKYRDSFDIVPFGLRFCLMNGFKKIEVESDALNVVHALNSFESDLSREGPIFDEIRLLKNEFQAAQWKKIPRSSNKVVHQLAKEAVKYGGIKFWKEIGPV